MSQSLSEIVNSSTATVNTLSVHAPRTKTNNNNNEIDSLFGEDSVQSSANNGCVATTTSTLQPSSSPTVHPDVQEQDENSIFNDRDSLSTDLLQVFYS